MSDHGVGKAADEVLRLREGLIQIELSAGKNASYEERAGSYALAQLHRDYAQAAKNARMGLSMQGLFPQKDETQ